MAKLKALSFPRTIMAHEIELKLAFPPSALTTILAHPRIAQAPRDGQILNLINAYFDTADMALQSAGMAVRTRKSGEDWLQTVKCASESVGGLSSRPEWEQRFDGQFDFSAIEVSSVRKTLESHAADLVPLFITEFERDTRIAEPLPGVRILIMIDTGKITAGDREAPIHEVELELAQGSPVDLLNFAIELALDLPLSPFDQSKAERGYRLFSGEKEAPARVGRSPIKADWTPTQAFRARANQIQGCWQANLHGALASGDPEFVHQFRVTLRRMRTLLKIFKPYLPSGFAASWSNTLRDLASTAGDARDLDVLRDSVLQPVLDARDGPALEALMVRALSACEAARQAAHGSLSAIVHGVPLLTFAKAVHTLPEITAPEDLTEFARARLKRLHSRTRKRLAATIATQAPETSHKLRIALKHLRYGCDSFAPLFDEAAMQRYTKSIGALQDELGFLNDLNVAWHRIDEWAQGDPALLDARSRVTEWHAERAEEIIETVFSRTQQLLEQPVPWRDKH